MTRLESLRALQKAVEAGTATNFRAILSESDNTAERAKRCGWAASAFKGNLNAALSLHKAVLGDAHWSIAEDDDFGFCARVFFDGWQHEHADNPARAWLLAVLAALIAQEQAQ